MNTKHNIRQTTPEEHVSLIEIMTKGLGNEDPKVGIFWYNPSRNELFGVVALSLDDPGVSKCPYGKTSIMLHRTYWQKEYRRLKYKEHQDNTFPYIGSYMNKPRGRVFFRDGKFQIAVGDWIHEGENYKAIDLVIERFDLTQEDVEILEDHHWNIGEGWDIG
jgi:hypothetical protein